MKLGVLCSGNLGYSLLLYLKEKWDVDFVCTDLNSITIIKYCEENNIKLFVGNPRNGKISSFINDKDIDVIISVNYLFIVDLDLIRLPKLMAFNVHGSLLPKYRGRTPHVWAIINNEKVTGITAHLIDEGCDTGDIIDQVIIPITNDDTGATLLQKYEVAYIPLIHSVLEKIESKTLSVRPQEHLNATFYGKRTPEDGLINWSWQKERISNWIRALSNPYPGAFSFYGDRKIIIDEICDSDFGYNFNMDNGTILCINPLIVKTPNGAIEIVRLRDCEINFVLETKFVDTLL